MRVMFGGHTPADAVYLSELDTHAEGSNGKTSRPRPCHILRNHLRKGEGHRVGIHDQNQRGISRGFLAKHPTKMVRVRAAGGALELTLGRPGNPGKVFKMSDLGYDTQASSQSESRVYNL